MQQLTAAALRSAIQRNDNHLSVALPLPASVAQATHLAEHIAQSGGFTVGPTHWGADRLQVMLIKQDISALLCIEWLCEAMWIEPTGTAELTQVWQAFQPG
ncbi:DUF3630 family protein [Salinimonas sediminis]|uniref:DUF3630 family protein n=1 Tax=Salinimonas sediminis TaxID=2303538 RepID=A0A346NRK6_9ALTE|nr:DUF3630 family protein [Salinimonas sediminis]AXR08163.1 DUF3630 family protein [Salinimonas sediminis]